MGGYGYNQSSGANPMPKEGGGNNSSGGDLGMVVNIGKAGYQAGSSMAAHTANAESINATGSVAGATSASVGGGATAGSVAGGTAAEGVSSAVGASVGAGVGSSAAGTSATSALALLFYGGETVSQIKSNSQHQIHVIGGSDGIKTGEDRTFYSNVHIPRKQV